MDGSRVTPVLPRVKGRSHGPSSLLSPRTKRSFSLPCRLRTQQWLSGRTCAAQNRKFSLENHSERLGRPRDPQAPPDLGSWGAPMTRQNPSPDRALGPPTRNPDPTSHNHTDLSYSDRVRNMVTAGQSDSGYAGILRANTSPPAPRSPTPPHHWGPAPNCACAGDPLSPPSCVSLLLVGRSSRRGDWTNALPRQASVGPGRAGQRSLFRFKSRVVARGARSWRQVLRVRFFENVWPRPKVGNWENLYRKLSWLNPWLDRLLADSRNPRQSTWVPVSLRPLPSRRFARSLARPAPARISSRARRERWWGALRCIRARLLRKVSEV